MKTVRVGLVVAFACGAARALACSSFTSSDLAPGDASPDDGAAEVDAAPDAPDAPARDVPSCPAAAYPASLPAPGMLPKRTLYSRNSANAFPQQLAVDQDFVYWVEQATAVAPYGMARVLRTDREVGNAHVVVIAESEPGVSALALDGPYVYWARTTMDTGSGTTTLMRAPRACTSCVAEQVAEAPGRITTLRRVAAGVLFGVTQGARLARFDLGTDGGNPTIDTTFFVFTLTSTTTELFTSYYDTPEIRAFDFDFTKRGTFATAPDGGPGTYAGFTGLTTDCTSLWGGRRESTGVVRPTLERLDLASKSFDDAAVVGDAGVYPDHLAVDERYVYIASIAGGLFAHDRATRATAHVAGAETIAVAVDAVGIYWGDLSTGNIEMIVKE